MRLEGAEHVRMHDVEIKAIGVQAFRAVGELGIVVAFAMHAAAPVADLGAW
ncbi:MAG: hypothetical protein ACI9DC_000041 [Gammaproteobacteria bacterium]|jgi:hypothetical protein